MATRFPDWLTASTCLVAGMLCLALMPALPSYRALLLLSLAAVVMVWRGQLAWCCAGLFLLGFAWACAAATLQLDRWLPAAQDNQETEIRGVLTDFPRRDERGWQFDFASEGHGGLIRLVLYDTGTVTEKPRLDCRYHLRVKLRRPRGLLNDGLYDYQLWLLQAGYVATGHVKTVLACEAHPPSRLLQARQRVIDAISASAVSAEAQSTLEGLVIGSYAKVDAGQWQVWRDSGAIHLLSVSGLHIALIAGLVYVLVQGLAKTLVWPLRFWPAAQWGAVASLGCAVVYALLAGLSVATQRALLMVAITVFQRCCYGRFAFGTSLVLSCCLILLCQPLAQFSVGFWFSFWATAVLLLAHYGHARRVRPWWLALPQDAWRLQWLLFLAVAPLMLHVYGKVMLVSIPMNLIAVPWASLVSLPLGLLGAALVPLAPALSQALFHGSGWTLDVYWQAMRLAVEAGQDWQWVPGVSPLLPAVVAAAGVCIATLAPVALPLRYLGWALCLPLLFSGQDPLQDADVRLRVLDVGQGLAVVVQTRRHVLVYDVGDRRSSRFDAGRDIVAAALRAERQERIDLLMLSHGDSDHAGGATGLLGELPAFQVWSGTPPGLPMPALPCRAGMHWRWDGVRFTVLHPDAGAWQKSNDRSCVLLIDNGRQRVLLAGDIEAGAERAMLRQGKPLHAEVLVVPHHGSKTSSTMAFVQAVSPSLAIISSGHANRFGHPHPAVLSRYRSSGITIANTAELGAITVNLSGEEPWSWGSALCRQRVFWRAERYAAACGN